MTTVADIQTRAESLIAGINSEADAAVERLEDIASLPFQIWVDFASKPTIELDKAPTVVTSNDFPTLDRVSFDTSIGEFDPNAYKQNVYDSEFFTFLEPYLQAQIDAGGPGISQDVQDALFDNMRERDLQILSDATDAVRANYGKRGFPLPTSVLRGQENEVIKKYQDDRSNRNREVTALIAERAADFVKTAVNAGISMEQVRMNFALGFSKLFTDITQAAIARFKAEQDARITEFKGQIDVILSKLQVGKINADLDLAYQAQLLKQWEIEASQATEQTKALIQQGEQTTQVKLGAAQSLATYYAALASSAATQLTGIAATTETTTLTTA